jgi:hypothetical protein
MGRPRADAHSARSSEDRRGDERPADATTYEDTRTETRGSRRCSTSTTATSKGRRRGPAGRARRPRRRADTDQLRVAAPMVEHLGLAGCRSLGRWSPGPFRRPRQAHLRPRLDGARPSDRTSRARRHARRQAVHFAPRRAARVRSPSTTKARSRGRPARRSSRSLRRPVHRVARRTFRRRSGTGCCRARSAGGRAPAVARSRGPQAAATLASASPHCGVARVRRSGGRARRGRGQRSRRW